MWAAAKLQARPRSWACRCRPFSRSAQACRAYLASGAVTEGLDAEIAEHLAALEVVRGKRLGEPADSLLVSVRSGAKFSMPGMMENVLNIGLNHASVHGLSAQSDNPRFAWDSLASHPDVR
jgi:pyruvate, orthophosphate dikinase